MTLTPRAVHRDLIQARDTIDRLIRRLPPAVHNMLADIDDPTRDRERPEATGRRKGWINDPTGTTAVGRVIRTENTADLTDAQIATLRLTLALLTRTAEHYAPILGERTRCNGGRTVDAWSDPSCTNWAETWVRADGSEAVRGDGLCTACRKRKERWERGNAA